MMNTRNHRQNRLLTLAAATGLAMAAGLAGCDDSGPAADALASARVQLSSLSPDGTAPASDQFKQATYSKVVTTLQAQAGKGTPSQNATAYVLLSQAQAGLAALPAEQAGAVEREALRYHTETRAALEQWLTHNALAKAFAAFDPGPELAEIARQIQDRETAIQREQARKAEVDARVGDLRNQATAKADQARAKRRQESEIVARISEVSAVEGETLLREAIAIRRQADALDAEAGDLLARAAQIAPQSDQIQLEVDRLSNQRTLLLKARDEVNQRARNKADRAKSARDEASKDATAISELLAILEEQRAASRYDEAVRGYEAAAGTARRARDDSKSRSAAGLAGGVASQSLGDVHWQRAHALARQVELYEALASASPALPQASAYRTRADELKQARQAALEAATAAYTAAAESYRDAGGTGDAQARLQAVLQRLAEIVDITSNRTKDLRADLGIEAPPPAPRGATSAPSVAADTSSPQGTLQLVIEYSRDKRYDDLAALFHFESSAQRAFMTQAFALGPKFDRLDQACKARFGSGLESAAQGMGGFGNPAGSMAGFEDLSAGDFDVAVQGDTATVTPPGGGQSITLRNVGGQWLVDMGNMPGMDPASMAMGSALFAPMGRVVDELAAEVESGRYSTLAEVMQALGTRMQQAMMGGMRPGGG